MASLNSPCSAGCAMANNPATSTALISVTVPVITLPRTMS